MDEETEAALERLQAITPGPRGEVIRRAILEADRQAQREAVRREAEAVANDPVDRAEVAAIMSYFEDDDDAW